MAFELRQELSNWKYWVRLLIISLIVMALINWFGLSTSIKPGNVAFMTLFIGIADIVAHLLIQLD